MKMARAIPVLSGGAAAVLVMMAASPALASPGQAGHSRSQRSRQDHLDPQIRGHRHRRPGLGGQRRGAHRLDDHQQRLAGRVPVPRPPRDGGGSHGLGAAAAFPPGHLVHLLRPQHAPVQPPGDPAWGHPGRGQLRLVGVAPGRARPGHALSRAAQRAGRLLEVHRRARVRQARQRARPGLPAVPAPVLRDGHHRAQHDGQPGGGQLRPEARGYAGASYRATRSSTTSPRASGP